MGTAEASLPGSKPWHLVLHMFPSIILSVISLYRTVTEGGSLDQQTLILTASGMFSIPY